MRLRKSWFTRSLFIAGLAILSASPAWAQLYSGSLTGVITDPSGAAIPGARHRQQGFVFNADFNGRYPVRAIPADKYKLTVQAQRFQGEERTGVVIDVNQNVTISLTLAFATTRQSVEAISQAAELGTQNVVTGQVVDRKFINDLTPGVVSSRDGGQTGGQGNNLWRLQ